MPDAARPVIGVVGSGTMGGGIAEVAAVAGYHVQVQDVSGEILDRNRRRLEQNLQHRVARGRLDAAAADAALARMTWTDALDDLTGAGVVIEAAPEDLSLKRELFRRLDEVCETASILASNTSSLSISAMGAVTRRPDRVIGMHFFNPVPLMALVEVIRGARTSEATVDAAVALARALGKTPVNVMEAPGFLVNRVARPFTGEALRVLAERVADAPMIDRIMREAGGFKMGPFELLDLIGLDVNLAVSAAIYDAFFHDPRYQPHPLQQRMVDAGLLGQKSGRGFYDYAPGAAGPRSAQEPGTAQEKDRRVTTVGVVGENRVAVDLVSTLRGAGLQTHTEGPNDGRWQVEVAIHASVRQGEQQAHGVAALEAMLRPDALLVVLTLSMSATEAARYCVHPERVVGFATLPPCAGRRLIEVQAGMKTSREAVGRAIAFLADAGTQAVEVGDGVGGVFPRIQAMLSHEAIVALDAGIASASEIDTAMRLGMNYPQGPIARAESAGLDTLLAIIEGLFAERGDPRYRPAPLLRRLVAAGQHTLEGVVKPSCLKL
ncbi:MAG: 3-hydroxyacyl-CoA dehydrogenase [Armatimonadota bacterium]